MTLHADGLRSKVVRYRTAERAAIEAERVVAKARTEFTAARQELIDAIEAACKEIR